MKKASIALFALSIGIALPFIPSLNKDNKEQFKGIVVDARENYYLFKSNFETFYIYDRENNKECGDSLSLTGYLKDVNFATYESQFDFNEYLLNKGVKRSLVIKKEEIIFKNPLRINKRKAQFLNKFDEDTASLIDSFLFNHKDYSNETLALADSLNLMSLLSMNGIYLYFIISQIEFLLLYIFKEKTANLIATLFLLPYALFSFTKFGVVRVLLMRIFSYINKHILKTKLPYLSLLSLECLLCLLADFHLIYQQTFYIGFLISFVLIYIRKYSKKVKKRLLPFIPILSVGFLLLPISINSSHELHLLTPLFQVILLPVHETFAVSSLLSLYTFPFRHYLSAFARLIRVIYKDLSYVDIAVPAAKLTTFSILAFYINCFFLLLFIESKRHFHINITIGVLTSLILISVLPIKNNFRNAVYFINVGQGDSILIQNKNHAVMIDTGGNKNFDMAQESLIPFLHQKQIYKLDALIITHDDFDHNGAKESLCHNFKVGACLESKRDFPYQFGEITLFNLNTLSNINEDNEKSLVLSLNFMNKKWLFMGDATTEVEQFLIDKNLDLDCDILKIGHHGSKTSTSEMFLQATSPSEAIISVGQGNYYGHPNSEVLERLKKYNVNIRRTDIEGTISFVQFAL